MTMRGGWIWLVEIEGLARAGLTGGQFAITPMALTSEPWPGDSAYAQESPSSRVCDEWQDVLQPGSVTLSGMTYAPFSASPGAQTLSFSLAMPDARPEIADYFLAQAQPVAEITTAIAPTDTTITMTDTSAIAAGDVLYIGAECFRVASVDSGTVVTVATAIIGEQSGQPASDWLAWPNAIEGNVGDRSTAGAVGIIGAIGSRIAQHDVPDPNDPPPWPDTRVYLTNTRVKGRRVYLRRVSWGQDANGAYGYREQLIGQFLITGSQIGSDSTTVTVTASSLVASYDKAQLGARGVSDRLQLIKSSTGAAFALIDRDQDADAYTRRIWNGTVAAYATATEGGLFVGVEPFGISYNGLFLSRGVRTSRSLGLKLFEATESIDDVALSFVDKRTGLAVKEVLLSDPLQIPRDTTGFEQLLPPVENQHPYYSTDKPGGAGILTHPLHLMLAHLGQLDSNLPYHWQLRLDTSAVATTYILQLAEQLSVNEWPGVCVTGPVKAMEWLCETFLRPLGCGWVVDEYGRLSVGAITIPRLSPWAAPRLVDGTDAVNTISVAAVQMGRGVQRIVEAEAGVTQSQTGQGLGKEPRYIIQSADAWRIPDGDPQASTFVLNAMGAMSPDNTVSRDTAFDLRPVSFVRTVTSTIGTYLRGGSIQYTLTVPSGFPETDELYAPNGTVLGPAMPSRYALPGSAVIVENIPGLRKPAGRRLCIVMGHQWVDDCTAQTLRLLDAGGAVRVAAAGRVVSASEVGGMLEVVLEPAFEVSPTPYVAPPFAPITEDGETLTAFASTVGEFEFVRFCDETLAEQGTGSEQVNSYDVATNTLTTSYNEGYIPVAGDFVLFSAVSDVDDVFAFVGRDRFNL